MATATVTAGSELLHTLAHFVDRDDAGRHFTERYADDSVEALEALGLIAVTRPVHDATGLPYGHEHWHAEVTEAGVELVERLYDARDYGGEEAEPALPARARILGRASAATYADEFGAAPGTDGPEGVGDWDVTAWDEDRKALCRESGRDDLTGDEYAAALAAWRDGFYAETP